MLRESELRALAELREPMAVSDLAERLDRSRSRTSEVVSALEAKGLVRKGREGKSKRVAPTESKAVELYHDLTRQFAHVDWPALLSGPTIPLLYYLDEPVTVVDLAERTDNYRNTVHRRVKRLLDRGILGKADSRYALTDEFRGLNRFAREYVHHAHRQRASESVEAFTLIWEDYESFLIRTDETVSDESFLSTGPERFEEFDLPLLATETRYYFYPAEGIELTPEELICHMLVIDTGTRFRSYCLLLLSKAEIDEKRLRERGETYGVSGTVDELLAYLHSEGEETTPSLPSWEGFRELAEDYGVAV